MSYDLKQIKEVDSSTTLLVSGYLRQWMPNNVNDTDLPSIVVYLCILHYAHFEYFTAYSRSNTSITVKSNIFECDTVVMKECKSWAKKPLSVYGKVAVCPSRASISYVWTIKIIRHQLLYIGIDSSNKRYTEQLWTQDNLRVGNEPYYSYISSSYKESHQLNSGNADAQDRQYGSGRRKDGDIIKMKLFVNSDKTSQLTVYVNGKDQGIMFQNIDFSNNKIQYHMAIGLYPGAAVQLLGFER
eukprot:439746_1